MAFDIINERRLTITDAARKYGVSAGCGWRWVLYGVRGGTVKLESALIGGRRFTSEEAMARFVARLNSPPGTPPEVRKSNHTEAAIAAAEREWDETAD